MAHYDLQGKVALVTGGARGIGLETGRALAARGASVVLVDLNEDDARRAAAELGEERVLGLAGDVTDRGAMQQAVAQAVERFGGLDVVVANAGIAARAATFRATNDEAFDRVIDVDLHGVVRTVSAALPQIVARRGHVVVVSSIYAFTNGLGAVPYAMSKAAVEQLGRALRVELALHGASATIAYFGFIDTAMVHQAIDDDPLLEAVKDRLPRPLRKRLTPRVAGEAIVRGIEKRSPQIIQPRRWTVMSLLRGPMALLSDQAMIKDAKIQEIARGLDARGGEAQPFTAAKR